MEIMTMARPRLIKDTGETITMATQVHQIIRVISKGMEDTNAQAFSGATVDSHISVWLEQGYEMFNSHYLGMIPEGYLMLYILVKKV